MSNPGKKEFQVALSFGGEDRQYAQGLAELLKPHGVHCFYDEDFTVETWGENLTEYFADLYRKRALFVVPFLSKSYLRPWPTLEKRAALAEALLRSSAYILPVRIDDTEIPGILPTVGMIDLRTHPLEYVRDALLAKLKLSRGRVTCVSQQTQRLLAVLRFFPRPLPLHVVENFLGANCHNTLLSVTGEGYARSDDGVVMLLHPERLAPDGAPSLDLGSIGRHLCNFVFGLGQGVDPSNLESQLENIFALVAWANQAKEFELVLDFFPLIEKDLKLAGDKNRLLRVSTMTVSACHNLKASPALQDKATRMEARAKICGLTWVYQRIGRLDAALQEVSEGLELCEAIGDWESFAFGKKCQGRLMRMRGEYEESIRCLVGAREQFEKLGPTHRMEVGDSISLLGRTYFERSTKTGGQQDLRQAENLQRAAYDILQDFPNTKDLADCLILEGDILAAANLSGPDSCYNAAKTQIPEKLRKFSEVYARACLHHGRWCTNKGDESTARQELQKAQEVYDRLDEADNSARARLVLSRLVAEKSGQGEAFRRFAKVAKDEANPEVRLLAWTEHCDRFKRHAGVKRAGQSPNEQYWLDLLRFAREKWALKERSLH